MNQIRKEKLRRFALNKAEYLKLDDLIPRLVTLRVITIEEKQKLQQEESNKGSIAAAHLLVEFLNKKDNLSYDKFVSALEATGQKDLANTLQHELSLDALLSTKDQQTIQRHFSELVNGIEMKKLLPTLKKEKNYFTNNEIAELESSQNEPRRGDAFITKVIMKGTYKHLALLKKALLAQGQERLASLLPVDTDILAAIAQPLEPEIIKLQAKLVMSRPFESLRALIVTKIVDPSQDLRKKLIVNYQLHDLQAEAVLNNENDFIITMIPNKAVVIQKIKVDVDSGHFALLLKQYSHVPDNPSWKVEIKTNLRVDGDDSREGASNYPRLTGNGNGRSIVGPEYNITPVEREIIYKELPTFQDHLNVEEVIPRLIAMSLVSEEETNYLCQSNPARDKAKFILDDVILKKDDYTNIEKFRSILEATKHDRLAMLLPKREFEEEAAIVLDFPRVPPPNTLTSSRSSDSSQGPSQLPIVKSVLFTMINGKDHTPYDLFSHLKKYKGKVYQTPMQLRNEEGFNLLHACIDKGRLSLFLPLMHMGWWKFLSEQRVPEDSLNEHKGKIPKQIAEVKRTRKPLDEINQFTEWENSLSSVMKACRQGDGKKVKQQLEIEVEQIHYRDANNGNALYWAVVGGKREVLEMLLEAGIDAKMRTKKQETLLHIACMLGHHHMIKLLMEHCREDAWLEDQNHKTAYDRVAENGDIDTLIEMMKCGLNPKECFPVLAAYSGRKPCLEYWTEKMNMPVDCKDIYDRTSLHRAIEGSRVEITKYLLDKKARINLLTSSLRNVLHIVAESGSVPILNMLLDILKTQRKLEEMINELDRYNGVDLCFLIRGRDRGRDAWHYVEVGRSKVPIFLKKTKSGNVDVATFGAVIKSGWGVNPDQDMVDEIEDMFKTRRLNKTAPRDMTPLHIAIFKGNTDVAKILLENGAKTNIKDKFGLTPLMVAAAKGFLDIIQNLERRGAKFKEVNVDGKTASDIADENEHDEIVNYVKGRDYYSMSTNFLSGDIARLKEELSPERLDAVRASGADVKRHIVNTLRDFRIDINQFLLDLGSGPVLEASEN